MEAELKSSFENIEVEWIKGDRGIFDIHVDGDLIYSKYETGGFPSEGEVTELIRDAGLT